MEIKVLLFLLVIVKEVFYLDVGEEILQISEISEKYLGDISKIPIAL